MLRVAMTSTSTPSLKDNELLLIEITGCAISDRLHNELLSHSTRLIDNSDLQRNNTTTTLLYICETKLEALRSIHRPASHLTGHNLTTIDGNTGVGSDGPALIEQYLNRCQGHWFESLCV